MAEETTVVTNDPTTETTTTEQQMTSPDAGTNVNEQNSTTASENNPQQTSVVTANDIQYGTFTVPDGFEAPNEEFLAITKELGIPQEGVQKVVDYYTQKFMPAMFEQQQQAIAKQNETWTQQSIKDVGQDGVERAKLAYKQYATPELTELFNQTGLGSHPAVVKMFAEIGKQMGESTLVNGKASGGEPKRAADILFGE